MRDKLIRQAWRIFFESNHILISIFKKRCDYYTLLHEDENLKQYKSCNTTDRRYIYLPIVKVGTSEIIILLNALA